MPTPDILTDLSRPALTAAVKANLYAFFRSLGRSPQVDFYESPNLVRWQSPIPHPWFNGVLSTRPPAGDQDQTIQDTLSYFRSRGVTGITWWLEPHVPTAGWASHFLAHGFRYDANTPGMAVELAALPSSVQHPNNLVLQVVEDLETLSLWTHTFFTGYGIAAAFTAPFSELLAGLGTGLPYRYYLGYLAGRPVAASTLFLGAGVAGIYNVATAIEARGMGLGTALTLLPLQEAREMGYRAGILQSSAIGFNVYRRLGFETMCQMEHFYYSIDSGDSHA
ncbi:MAG: hypothetical protein L0332_10320 [Chloroflexi bacterium]|nr:hypothetical protein [Chloroflexota bacterium]MCI0576061.1 hypothetical protein [Chloroflexota bacterium]MCI0647849.1 hypothetical protein [Chloroflexota bacterium]MCI0727100.1 hypothetical protein [Chloroflexota bacterium]